MPEPLVIVAALAVLGVLVILMIGIGGFARDGEFNRRHGNRLMRWRIIAQAGAVALILLFVAARQHGAF
ncbi:hypoxia induced protein [Cereibacter ovatus]|uniref:Hypoxia induced protein n=1 Tax=Cereibacter ovatus TaxID=439529 RepID=A0A285CLH6_9RHOB|nr:hypoxia induced protein [Cereibacter ovatus]